MGSISEGPRPAADLTTAGRADAALTPRSIVGRLLMDVSLALDAGLDEGELLQLELERHRAHFGLRGLGATLVHHPEDADAESLYRFAADEPGRTAGHFDGAPSVSAQAVMGCRRIDLIGYIDEDSPAAVDLELIGEAVLGCLRLQRNLLRKSALEVKYRALMANAADAIFLVDTDGNYVEANRAAVEMLGYSREELTSMTIRDLTITGRPTVVFQQLKETGQGRGEATLVRKDGSHVVTDLHAVRVDLDGVPYFLGITRDLTERVELEQRLRRKVSELSALEKVSRAISQSLESRKRMRLVLDTALDITGTEAGSISVLNDRTGHLDMVVYKGLSYDFTEYFRSVKLGDGASAPAVRSKQPQRINPADIEPEDFRHMVEKEGIVSAVTTPLISGDRVVGVMNLASASPMEFSDDDLSVLAAMGRQIGLAIENAALYEANRAISEALQANLAPTAPPALPDLSIGTYYASATLMSAVGGDFYDFIELPDERLLLVMGDICGKGVSAATSTGVIRNLMRAAASRYSSVSEIVSAVNDSLRHHLRRNEYATLFAGLLDRTTFEMTYTLAGHPPPVLLKSSAAECGLLATTGDLPVGIFSGAGFKEATVRLTAGDTLLMYTDGATEARGDGGFYGEERMMKDLVGLAGAPASDIPGKLFGRIQEFSHGHLADDIAVVAVQVPASGDAEPNGSGC